MSQLKRGLITDGKFKHLRSSQKQHIRNVGISPAIMYQCFLCYSQKVKIKMILFFRLPSSWTIFASKKQAKDVQLKLPQYSSSRSNNALFFSFKYQHLGKQKSFFLSIIYYRNVYNMPPGMWSNVYSNFDHAYCGKVLVLFFPTENTEVHFYTHCKNLQISVCLWQSSYVFLHVYLTILFSNLSLIPQETLLYREQNSKNCLIIREALFKKKKSQQVSIMAVLVVDLDL